ncbi:Ig-like domain-containing protein [Staphylococcus equorum]|uniref:Ig-like domain-containing protein n=1 Tax=Staphylococcus equorum TaxID=246432 RepID=UPI0020A0C5A2|nr:Ig-like domain-containing protein [Staphylococcus equorum]
MAAPTAITTADATNEQVDKSLGYVDNYTFASLIFDHKTLSSQGALDSKEIDFNIDSYMSGANSGDRYKIDLKLDPIIAKHVTKISVNPANRSKPVEFVRLTDDQGNLTNTWEVNFIRANNGLFGGAEILSQYSAENGKIYLDDTVRNIINEVGDLSNNKLNYQMFVRDSSENKIVRTTESSGYFLTNADSDLIQLQNKISTANSKSFTSSSGSAVFNSDIGNNGGIIIDQQVMKDGIFSYNTAGNKQWSYNYQIDKDLLPYIESAELHIYDYAGLAGFDKTYYASNKVADLTLDTIGNGKITSENLNDLISFNNSLPETVGMRIVLKLNQSVNNILTKEALYDSTGNLISETTKQKEDFTFAGYLTDNGGMLINNTMGTSTLALQDYDKDGLLDRYERQVSLSDAEVLDTDADGKNDGDEVVNYKTSPLVGLPVVADINMADTIVSGSVPLKAGAVSQTAKVINADNQIIGSATVNSDGSFAIVIPSSPAGEYTIAIDSPNYVNDEVSKFNIIDNTIVPTPTIDPVDDNDTVIVVHGATGSTVTVTDNHNNVIGTVKITNDTTSGSITLSTPLEAGTVLTSTASENGKISDSSKTITVTDATAPDAPIINTVTSEDTQVSGTAEPGTSVRINFPGGVYTAITTDSNGNYTIDIPDGVILEGGESITATSKDDAGNISETATTIVTDITAPETPTVEELTSEDTQVNGTAEPNSEVTVTFPDGTTATGTTDEEGNYTIDIPTNIDLVGGEEVKVVATDKDGNVSEEGTTTVTDVTAPDAPTVEELTSEDTQVTGTGEAGSTITVKFPDGSTVTGEVDNQGNYAIDLPVDKKLNGNEELVVTSTDGAGNVSSETKVTVTDATAPAVPTINEVTSEDSQVSGTGEPGSTITVKFPDGSVVTGVADDKGNYAIDLPIDKKLKGNEELVVTSTDASGNVSAETKVTVTDVTAPNAPAVNEVTSESTQVTGTGEPGSTITVKFPDGSVVTSTADNQGNYAIDLPIDKKLNGNEELVVTSTDGAGNVSAETRVTVKDTTAPDAPTVNEVTSEGTQVTGTGEPGSTITVKFPDGSVVTGVADDKGNYAIDLPIDKKLKGNEELVVTSTDGAGNVSREAKVKVKDTTAPAAPTVNEVTSESTQVTGTGEPGSTIIVKFPDGSVIIGTVDNQGNYVIDLPVDKKLKGNEELVITSTDSSGNVSRETKVTVKDNTAPNTPTVNEVTSGDTQLTGTGEPGSTITVKFPDGSVVTGTVDNQGNYVIDLPVDKKLDGNEELVITSTDSSGNVSRETKVTVKDATAPAAPTVNKVTSGDTQVTGTGEPGSTITVKFPNGTIVTGRADNQGNYVINIPSIIDLNPGDTIQVSSIDKSGNMSGTTTIIVNNSSVSITKQANDHDKSSNNFDLNSQLGLNGIEGEDGKEHRNPNSNSKHSDDSVNHKSGTDIASKGDVIQANDKKGTISTMNNDKNNLDKGNNKHVDKLPTTGENENQNKGLFSSLLAMIGAFILIGRRRKNKEEH